jgi:hypothetical protein
VFATSCRGLTYSVFGAGFVSGVRMNPESVGAS